MNEDDQQQQQQQHDIDPFLKPGELRQIVNKLPSRIKHPHSDYDYSDAAKFETEIEEFFNYSEVENELKSYQQEYETSVDFDWCKLDEDEQRRHIERILDRFEHSVRDERVAAAKQLLCIGLGYCHGDDNEPRDRVDVAIANTMLINRCGALTAVFQAFNRGCKKHDTYNSQSPVMEELSIVSNEIELYISIMYLILEAVRTTKGFSDDHGMLDPSILRNIFEVTSQLRDKYLKSFPVKKLVLLLWKAILATFGGFEELQNTRTASRICHGLEQLNADIVSKCTPQDLYTFQNEAILKYPNYDPPDIPLPITSSLTVKASPRLVKAMGISNATADTELPYQTLFPPKSSGNNTNSTLKKQQQQNLASLVWPTPQSESFVLPLDGHSPGVPQSTVEAGNLFLKNMHLSVANQQIIHEREKSIHKWEHKKEGLKELSDILSKNQDNQGITEAMRKRFEALEQVYASLVPELQNIVIVLLKLLLSTVTSGTNGVNSKQQQLANPNSAKATNGVKIDLEDADANRNREVLSKAISAILLLLLKWTKVSHVLKFEYISQLLVDSGCLLLILKILGLQEITTIVSAETEINGHSLFRRNQQQNLESSADTDAPPVPGRTYTNCRNMFWTINFLRILQMLTKRKTNRVMLLVQYKSSAILKRVLKVSHPMMELYALKVLKSQVPYLGRKWRSLNMKIISAIYLRCYTALRDDWISKSDTEVDLEDGMVQETNLRMLIRIYHGQRYIPALLPQQDEPSGLDNLTNSSHDSTTSLLDKSLLDDIGTEDMDISLDAEFTENYEEWLESNVYSSEDDDGNEDCPRNLQEDAVTPGTPLPSSPIIAHADVAPPTHIIGTFYKQGLEEAFSAEQLITLPGYDSSDDDDALDPMQKLTHRLLAAEQRAIQRYTNLSLEDTNCTPDPT
ncbi:hypothetical protein BDB00DRAFT_833075 [Zychaea mexicana]|uniref:uncharacterized protein n=1 Tax=Zychaea mexicana TaxID=64656 RepID=UPI0022FEB5AC|nr:uncharacterized protein BDB00DRAFT_833075 [Zychaea mexicana]KAI9491454.1 hypothetical protein BDB00DRAFT_833075 [Zychaea mexicana]